MNPLENYFVISTIYLTVFYLFYLLFLSKDTQYKRNRVYLLSTVILSVILPLIKIQYNSSNVISSLNANLNDIISLGQINITNKQLIGKGLPGGDIIAAIYFTGLIIAFALLIYNACKLINRISKSKKPGSRLLLTSSQSGAGFSAFGYIFISKKLSGKEKQCVIEHELKHIDNKHFIDLALLRLISVFMWFNPLIYLYDRSIKAIHEYQVDDGIIKNGENVVSYQIFILNQIFKTRIFTLQNGFSGSSLTKKRIIMMTKKRSRKLSGLKLMLIIPVSLALFFIFSCSNENNNLMEAISENEQTVITEKSSVLQEKKEDGLVFVIVENPPTFLGGDVNNFREWVQKRIIYPQEAIDNGIQGKVIVTFIVEPDGSVSNVKILRNVSESIDKETIKVLSSSPAWVAGRQRGDKVRVRFAITVNFKLQ